MPLYCLPTGHCTWVGQPSGPPEATARVCSDCSYGLYCIRVGAVFRTGRLRKSDNAAACRPGRSAVDPFRVIAHSQ